MKGFIYFLELAISAILIIIILITFFTVGIKQDWERSHLISLGNDIFNYLKNSGNLIKVLNNDTSEIDSIIPPNIDYGLKVYGSPKPNIKVGCTNEIMRNYVDSLLTDTYVNNHWINFTVFSFDINDGIPSDYDAVVFVNYTEYSNPSVKSNITDYLNKGGVVIGINATFNNNDIDFNDIFGLSQTSSGGDNFYFTSYSPSEDEIEKYFLGLGFDINTNNIIDTKKWGYWYIWGDSRIVNITSTTVDIENKTDEDFIINKMEGETFNLKGPDLNWYTFKIKKIFWDNFVIIKPINTSFIFKDFSEANDVTGKVNIIALSTGQAEMTSNNTAIWISDFSWNDEYRTLVKAAIASRVKEWYVNEVDLTKEYVTVSSFFPLCCDMPETAELTLYLWYKV